MKNSLSRFLSGSTLFLVTLGFLGAMPTTADAFTGSGAGTAGDPYQITTCVQLQEMNDALSAYYKLMNNVDCTTDTHSGGALWNSGAGFTPVGSFASHFTGDFNGNNKVINGIFINVSNGDNLGLFGFLNSGSNVYNVGVENVDITGGWNVGGLAGDGGIGTIANSYTTGTVSATHNFAGGLTGGYTGTIINSYSTATVSGVGMYVGGLVGSFGGSGGVTNSYSTGAVSGDSYVGGLIGNKDGGAPVTNSFWDTETSGQATSAGGTGKSTVDMKGIGTYTTIAEGLTIAWDFVGNLGDDVGTNDYWDIEANSNSGYPYLSWQTFGSAGVPEFSTYMMILTLLAGSWMVNKKMIESRAS